MNLLHLIELTFPTQTVYSLSAIARDLFTGSPALGSTCLLISGNIQGLSDPCPGPWLHGEHSPPCHNTHNMTTIYSDYNITNQLARLTMGNQGSSQTSRLPSLVSHTHGRMRREERGIERAELQEAVKYGKKERANPGRNGDTRWRFTHKVRTTSPFICPPFVIFVMHLLKVEHTWCYYRYRNQQLLVVFMHTPATILPAHRESCTSQMKHADMRSQAGDWTKRMRPLDPQCLMGG